MLIDAVRWLQEAGLVVEQRDASRARDARADAVLVVAGGGHHARFAVQMKQRAPYPNELASLGKAREGLLGLGQPLLVVPFVSESLGDRLTAQGWSWADAHGDFDLRAPGLVFRQRRATAAPRPSRRTLPGGSAGYAVIRTLIRPADGEGEGVRATVLAARVGVSQPRVSQVLGQLQGQGLADKAAAGKWRPNREELLDRFLAEYPGPGGSAHFFYSLDPPGDVAIRASRELKHQVVASADVGPDLIRPWRRPTEVILYVKELIDPGRLGLVRAQGRHDANVVVRMPADSSVFPVPALAVQVRGVEVRLADPAQMIWDLLDLGGADRAEAAGELRAWLLTRH